MVLIKYIITGLYCDDFKSILEKTSMLFFYLLPLKAQSFAIVNIDLILPWFHLTSLGYKTSI